MLSELLHALHLLLLRIQNTELIVPLLRHPLESVGPALVLALMDKCARASFARSRPAQLSLTLVTILLTIAVIYFVVEPL